MSLIENARQENSPYVQLLLLACYAVAGFVIFMLLAFVIVFSIYGMELFKNPAIFSSGALKYRPVLQIFLLAQSAGLFLVPPLFLAFTETRQIKGFYGLKKPKAELFIAVILIMAVTMPLIEWVAILNQKMVLPDFLKGIEKWMRNSEDEVMQTTILLLKMDNIKDFLINIFLIAIIPAVSEELMFRGGLQRTFTRMFKNPHVAIWVSAFLFSAIHLQFYGFLPRFLLGAGFGYLYFLSGSLWYSILGHFLNNAYAVCAALYMQKNNIPLSQTDKTMDIAWYGYLISLILSFILFWYFKNKTSKVYEQQLD